MARLVKFEVFGEEGKAGVAERGHGVEESGENAAGVESQDPPEADGEE